MKKRRISRLVMAALFGIVSFAHAGEKGKPLKVYIPAGQSNMQGQAAVSTIPAMDWDPASKALHDKFVDEAGKAKICQDVQVAAISQQGGGGAPWVDKQKTGPLTVGFGSALTSENRCGPELGSGITMLEHLNEPILIIKTAWGGKSLHTDFRPPGGGMRVCGICLVSRL